MARYKKEEQEYTLLEAKAIIFKIVSDELEGYMTAKEKLKEAMAEMQRQRYSAAFQIIDTLGWNKEFISYRTALDKERTMTKK